MKDWFQQRGIFDFENKKKKLDQLNLEINKKGFWDNPQYAQKVSIEASTIEKLIMSLSSLENDLKELKELINAGLNLSAASKYLAKKNGLKKSLIYNLKWT